MAGDEIGISNSQFAIKYFSTLLAEFEHFVFFGSLLGLHRDGQPILGDDDVDFYVCKDDLDGLKATLEANGIIIDYSKKPNDSGCFIQFEGVISGILVRVDFYLYEKQSDHILEKWNFMGDSSNPDFHMRVPNALIYPLTEHIFEDTVIPFPAQPDEICRFLYGPTWRQPRKKGSEYKIHIVNGKPKFIRLWFGREFDEKWVEYRQFTTRNFNKVLRLVGLGRS